MCRNLFAFIGLFGALLPVGAAEVRLAVASNFLEPVKVLGEQFEAQTGHKVKVSSGSTGKLYAQIVNGAPFDLFLAANSREPQRLEQDALIEPGTRFTYALGRLVLWAPDIPAGTVDDARTAFAPLQAQRVAIANPDTAPYGAAAVAVLDAWQMLEPLRKRLIRGENIAQTYYFVHSGNAAYGFVALSQMRASGRTATGSYWPVDPQLYPPIRQQAVLLRRAANNAAAAAFWRYLRSAPARETILAYGYALE